MTSSEDSYLREIVERFEQVYWLCEPACGRMYYVSPAYERLFQRSRDVLFVDSCDWLQAVHPDDRERMRTIAMSSDTHERIERVRVVRPDRTIRTIEIRLMPVCGPDGVVVRLAGVAEDVSDAVQLQEQVVATQRLEALAMLAGGVAHDFNNILAVIAANASLLEAAAVRGTEDHELACELSVAVRRGTMLTRQLLAFSRKQIIEPVTTDLNVAVADALRILRRMIGEDVVIRTSLEPDLAHIKIDPTNLVQVLMNLVVNARDAMPSGGLLTIETRNVPATGSVVLSVRDAGVGMSPEVMRRALEPLFTTKPPGKGTGLGLSVVDGIVRQAGGILTIESQVGVGTLVSIEIPSDTGPLTAAEPTPKTENAGTEKVVLVDDDCYVRRTVARVLRKSGYEVLEAADGAAALSLLAEHGSTVALLVTDVVMPVMDGRQLVESARRRRPSLPALYISGYIDDAVMRHGVSESEVPLIEKPFHIDSLASKVRRVIDAHR